MTTMRFKDLPQDSSVRVDDSHRRVISPTVQHSDLGAYGGLGDFVSQTASIFPEIEWALPFTHTVRTAIGSVVGDPVMSVPVQLFEPITGAAHLFEFEVYRHISRSGSIAWLFHNSDLMGQKNAKSYAPVAKQQHGVGPNRPARWDQFLKLHINRNAYQPASPPFEHMPFLSASELKLVHPLLRRYLHRADMLNFLAQCAVAKAIVGFITHRQFCYDVIWVHDWHFAAIAGELLLPRQATLAARVVYIQHLHNAIYQGIFDGNEPNDLLGWPASHFDNSLYRVLGQFNLLGGALNALRSRRLNGHAITVSENHAAELTTIERGVGLDQIFGPLCKAGRLIGINNPVKLPPDLQITRADEIGPRKFQLKKLVQVHFSLPQDPDAFLLLWTHRFVHQKQVSAVLQALESLLSEEHVDFQVAFFCDIETEGDSRDVAKLRDLMVRFRENIAFMPFDPRLEMLMASGADGAIMASFFEPFGYAPIWIAAQGGIVLTAANGGQLDIFSPESTFFLDIKADINKPRPIGWRRRLEHLLISNDEYRRRTFDHNVKAIRCGLLAAKQAYASPERRLALMKANMARISELARSDHFTNGVLTTILTNGFKPREDAASMERAGLDFKSLVLLLAAQRPDIGRFASWIRAYVENGTATVADGKRHSALRRQYSRLSQRIAIVRNEDSVKRLVNGSVHRAATKG